MRKLLLLSFILFHFIFSYAQQEELGVKQEKAAPRYAEIVEKLKAKDISAADELTTKALRQQPKDAYLWFLRGSVEMLRQNYEASEQALLKAVELDPGLSKARYNLGVLYGVRLTKVWSVDKAIKTLEELRRRDPDFAKLYYQLGQLYRRLERYKEAEQMLELALKKERDQWKTYIELAWVYRYTGRYQKVMDILTKGIKQFPKEEELTKTKQQMRQSIIIQLLDNYEFEKAMPIIKAGLKEKKDDANLIFAQAFIAAEQDDVKTAERLYKSLIERPEPFVAAYLNLARVYTYAGINLGKAEKLVNKSQESIKTPTWRNHVLLASIYTEMDKMDEALSHLKIAGALLDYLPGEPEGSRPKEKLEDEVKYAYAHYYYKQQKYREAQDWLSLAKPPARSLLFKKVAELAQKIKPHL